jgi:type IV secretion system protein VirB10
MLLRASFGILLLSASSVLAAQDPAAQDSAALRKADQAPSGGFVINPGTKIPLSLINSVSSKHSAVGDRIYLQTVFPIMSNGRIVIPPGSYVAGTVTQVKRPGRVKGRAELFLRFDSLTLPNGVTRDFRARVGGVDGRGSEELDRSEGAIRSEGSKASDVVTVAGATAAGASIGVIAGSAADHVGMGAGIGAAAGATAGLMGVLLSRGPEAILAKGSTIEMVLDRPLSFEEGELNFGNVQPVNFADGPGPNPTEKNRGNSTPTRRFPF